MLRRCKKNALLKRRSSVLRWKRRRVGVLIKLTLAASSLTVFNRGWRNCNFVIIQHPLWLLTSWVTKRLGRFSLVQASLSSSLSLCRLVSFLLALQPSSETSHCLLHSSLSFSFIVLPQYSISISPPSEPREWPCHRFNSPPPPPSFSSFSSSWPSTFSQQPPTPLIPPPPSAPPPWSYPSLFPLPILPELSPTPVATSRDRSPTPPPPLACPSTTISSLTGTRCSSPLFFLDCIHFISVLVLNWGASFRYYTTRIWIGTPPQTFALIVDTGSTLTYVPCSTCEQCGKHQVIYSSIPTFFYDEFQKLIYELFGFWILFQ